MLKSAWDELPNGVLVKAWNKIKNWDEDQYENEDNVPLSTLIEPNVEYNSTIQEVQLLLSKIGINVEMSIEDIESWNEDHDHTQHANNHGQILHYKTKKANQCHQLL